MPVGYFQFYGNLLRPAEIGDIIVVRGRLISNAQSFDINFSESPDCSTIVPLSLVLHFGADDLIRRTTIKTSNFPEDNTPNNCEFVEDTLPFVKGGFFTFVVMMGDGIFHIGVNNRPHCTFRYRCNVKLIKWIIITGDVAFCSQIDHRKTNPNNPHIAWNTLGISSEFFSYDIPQRYTYGDVIVLDIYLYGYPHESGTFTLYFTDNMMNVEKQSVLLKADLATQQIIRTGQNDDLSFMEEETSSPDFPFIINNRCRVAVGFTKNKFRFAINGKYYFFFFYRHLQLLDYMDGVRIVCENGLQVKVWTVQHYKLLHNCKGFEHFSKILNLVTVANAEPASMERDR